VRPMRRKKITFIFVKLLGSQVMTEWYLYLIRVRNGSLYTGIATDVERRFSEHVAGGKKGAKYLRGRGPLKLVFHQKIGNRSQALKAEAAVKKMPKAQKEKLLVGGPSPSVLLQAEG